MHLSISSGSMINSSLQRSTAHLACIQRTINAEVVRSADSLKQIVGAHSWKHKCHHLRRPFYRVAKTRVTRKADFQSGRRWTCRSESRSPAEGDIEDPVHRRRPFRSSIVTFESGIRCTAALADARRDLALVSSTWPGLRGCSLRYESESLCGRCRPGRQE